MKNFNENFNSNANTYLTKKREKEPIQKENKYNYDKSYNYEKFSPYPKYNGFKKYHSFMKDNYYWNRNNKNREDYYKGSKNYYYKGNPNKIYDKKNYSKYYHNNFNEGVRNISKGEVFSPQSLSLKEKEEEYSLNSIPCSTNLASPNKSLCRFNSKEINKDQENTNNEIDYKLVSNLEKEKIKEKKTEIKEEVKEEEKDNIKLFFDKLRKYNFFNRDLVKIEDNPIKNFEINPKNPFKISKTVSKNNYLKNEHHSSCDNSLESCYLLAKIQNWRLVSKFLPIPSLKNEKFEKILEKSEDEEITEKKNNKNDELKSYLVYSEKYEEIINGYLKDNMNKKKRIQFDIMNRKLICDQLQKNIFEIKNKIEKNKYDIKFIDAYNEQLSNSIEENKIL